MGGLCYEFGLLAYYLLRHFGFEVSFVEVSLFPPGGKYNPESHPPHAFNLITLKDKQYLIDPGFSFKAMRYPIEVDFSKDFQEIILGDYDVYRVKANDDHYLLSSNHLTDSIDIFTDLYAFERPLKPVGLETILPAYDRLYNTP